MKFICNECGYSTSEPDKVEWYFDFLELCPECYSDDIEIED